MPARDVFLCFDVGTQSLRASLIDVHGEIVHKIQLKFAAPDAPQPGWAEFPADQFWVTLVQATQTLLASHEAQNTSVTAIGVTCQRASIICLDGHGHPLYPTILWSDQRRTEKIQAIGGLVGLGMRVIGVSATVKHFQHEAEVNWLAAHQPKIWAETQKVVFVSGYLNYKLSGQFVDSSANQVGYMPFDFKTHRWARANKWQWRAMPKLTSNQLPKLFPVATPLGVLSENAAHALGLKTGVPIVACATDKACEVIGSGCSTQTQACLSFGTAATVNVTTERYTEVDHFVPAYPAAISDRFLCEVQTHRGFWLVSWFKQQFGADEIRRAETQSVSAEALLDELLETTQPGANGLIAQPYWSPGVRVPGPEARGALIGFNGTHTRAHVYRALLEGLIFSLKAGLHKIESATRTPVSSIRVAGGGSQSDKVMQITADVFNLPVERNREFEASSMGAAICCAVATNTYGDAQEAIENMTAIGKRFLPDAQTAKLYQRVFDDVYEPMYRRLLPLYKNILNMSNSRTL